MEVILQEVRNNILILTLNRPKALNALNKSVFDGLESVFSDNLSKYTGVIITGSGEKAFAAGADIKEFEGLSKDEGKKLSLRGKSILNKIEECPVPVIAAVNGYALGGGCELVLACHLIIAGEKAKFGFPEVNLGLIPGYSGTQRLIQRIGRSRALEYMMTTDMISAEMAVDWGLASYKVPVDQVVSKAEELLMKIASKGPEAISMVISSVNNFYDKSKNGDLIESEFFGRAMVSKQAKEGISAFLQKRKPNFEK